MLAARCCPTRMSGSFTPELEICAETPQACLAAHHGGAHRIEICTALDLGGLTPSHALVQAAIEHAGGTPVHVLLRPRPGDFVYSDCEFQMMCRDLEHAVDLGAAGLVVGILTRQRTVDQARVEQLVQLAGDKQVTFHRAIDHTRDLFEALEQIVAIGCGRLLTSGGTPAVRHGMQGIARLQCEARNRLRVAAGGGLTPAIAMQIRRLANVDLHASLRHRRTFGRTREPDPLWNGETGSVEISPAEVRAMAATLAVTPATTPV